MSSRRFSSEYAHKSEYQIAAERGQLPYYLNPQLTPEQQKYCDCVIEGASKSPRECLREKRWFQRVNGYSCSNPYAYCNTVGEYSRSCDTYYNFRDMDDDMLVHYADLKQLPVPMTRSGQLDRNALLQILEGESGKMRQGLQRDLSQIRSSRY